MGSLAPGPDDAPDLTVRVHVRRPGVATRQLDATVSEVTRATLRRAGIRARVDDDDVWCSARFGTAACSGARLHSARMRLNKTGTGPGTIIGRGGVDFHSQRGRVIQCADVGWDGEPALIPFLPGLAFDENLPNVRSVPGEDPNLLYGPGATRYGMAAQEFVLAEFADSTVKAQQRFDRESVLPTFDVMTLADVAPGEPVVDRLDYVVRVNHKKARIWMETDYSSKHARAALYASMHQLLWDWVASRAESPDAAVMLTALGRQFEYYRVHGIPSDFMLRQVGKAPFAAWRESEAGWEGTVRRLAGV